MKIVESHGRSPIRRCIAVNLVVRFLIVLLSVALSGRAQTASEPKSNLHPRSSQTTTSGGSGGQDTLVAQAPATGLLLQWKEGATVYYGAPLHMTILPLQDSSGRLDQNHVRVMFVGYKKTDGNLQPGSHNTVPPAQIRAAFSFVTSGEILNAPAVTYHADTEAAYERHGDTSRNDTLQCGGQTLTSGGSFFMVGGSHTGHFLNNGLESSCSPKEEKMKPGLSYGMEFPLASAATWRLVPDMTIPGASLEPTTPPGAKYLECPDKNDINTSYQASRWYPTLTRLSIDGGNERLLVTGGSNRFVPANLASNNQSIGMFVRQVGQTIGTWRVVYRNDPNLPIKTSDYPHVYELPKDIDITVKRTKWAYDILAFGGPAKPILISSQALRGGDNDHPFYQLSKPRPPVGPHPDAGATSAMLPLLLPPRNGNSAYTNGSIISVGGVPKGSKINTRNGTEIELCNATAEIDGFDPYNTKVSGGWFSGSMTRSGKPVRRNHSSSVLIPDGRLLVVAGQDTADVACHSYDTMGDCGTVYPHYVSVTAGPVITAKSADTRLSAVRGYHNVAALMPDGTVLIAGGLPAERLEYPGCFTGTPSDWEGWEQPTVEFFRPDYMTKPRPVIKNIVQTKTDFTVAYDLQHPAPANAVLIALGSSTHSFDMSQRYVQLQQNSKFANGSGTVAIPDPRTAPQGFYMLFLLTEEDIPSVAKIVQL